MQQMGGKRIDSRKLQLKYGDIMIMPSGGDNLLQPGYNFKLVKATFVTPERFMLIMDAKACFYFAEGLMPYAFGKSDPINYYVYEYLKRT